MSAKLPKVSRRNFVAGAALAGAAIGSAKAAVPAVEQARSLPSALPPTARVAATETGTPAELKPRVGRPGSDFMVDVIKSLDIKYLPCNPASSFRALHELLIDYGGNNQPEFLTCMHEEFGGRDIARLFQGCRQAAAHAVSWHCRPAARDDGHVQRVVRPRACPGRGRQ